MNVPDATKMLPDSSVPSTPDQSMLKATGRAKVQDSNAANKPSMTNNWQFLNCGQIS